MDIEPLLDVRDKLLVFNQGTKVFSEKEIELIRECIENVLDKLDIYYTVKNA